VFLECSAREVIAREVSAITFLASSSCFSCAITSLLREKSSEITSVAREVSATTYLECVTSLAREHVFSFPDSQYGVATVSRID